MFQKTITIIVPILLGYLSTFTIAVQAQVIYLTPNADTTIVESNPQSSFGLLNTLNLSTGENKSRALINFDLDLLTNGIISPQDIASATLIMPLQVSNSSWPPQNGQGASNVQVHFLTETWDEDLATWECASFPCNNNWNGGNFFSFITDRITVNSRISTEVRFDVTSDIAYVIGSGETFNGWLIRKQREDRGSFIQFSARESAMSPKLAITLTENIDLLPPTITITQPSEPLYIGQAPTELLVRYADDVSGVNINTLTINLNGEDIFDSCAPPTISYTSCDIGALVNQGNNNVEISLTDNSGKQTTLSHDFFYTDGIGQQGPKGDKGDTGDTGAQGPKGDKGDTGDTGAQGPKGDKGDTGDTGAQGPKGDTGEQGPQGPAGNNTVSEFKGIQVGESYHFELNAKGTKVEILNLSELATANKMLIRSYNSIISANGSSITKYEFINSNLVLFELDSLYNGVADNQTGSISDTQLIDIPSNADTLRITLIQTYRSGTHGLSSATITFLE